MLVRPRCPKCHSVGIPFDSKNPINHFCPGCGELLNADDALKRIRESVEKNKK